MQNAAEKKLATLIERLNTARGYVDNFDSFIDFALFPFLANPTEYQRKNFAEHRNDENYLNALLTLGEAAEGYHDCFGEIFMDRISHGANGQFFTPESICEFMAKITDPIGETINDCCCGSGRLLLQGLKNSREQGHEPWLYASDIDQRCCRMTLLNFCLNSARGVVTHMDALLLEEWGAWHIDRVMIGGKWMSWVWYYTPGTDMDALNAERRKQVEQLMSCGVFLETERPRAKTSGTPTEPKQEETPAAEPPQEAHITPPEAPKQETRVIPQIPKGKPVQLEFDFFN